MRRQFVLLLIDVYLIVLATLAASMIRDNFDFTADKVQIILPYLGWTVVSAVVVLPATRLSRSIWRFSSLIDYARTIPAVIAIVLGAVAIGFLFNRLDNVARALPILKGILMVVMLVGARVAFRLYHARRRDRPKLLETPVGGGGKSILVVGINRIAELYLQSVKEFAAGKIRVAGLIGRTDRHTGRLLQSVPVLGIPEDLVTILNELAVRGIAVDRIVVTTAIENLSPEARGILLDIERDSNITLDFFGERMLLDHRHGVSEPVSDTMGTVQPADNADPSGGGDASAFVIDNATLETLSRQRYWMAKRLMDIVAALVLLVVLSPLFVIVGLLVVVDIGWPVTFWQQRPGLGGYNFKLYKFRTMAAAHDKLGNRIADGQRLSAIGMFLRRTRLDELPQILHILFGEMSFVGPRPLLPVDQSPAHVARLLVRPGMTDWAQVKGGRGISATDKAALDIWYVNNASLRLDLNILLNTVPMVVVGERIDHGAIRQAWQDLAAGGFCDPASLPRQYRPTETAP